MIINQVATIVGSIICSILLVGHAAAQGVLGQSAENLVSGPHFLGKGVDITILQRIWLR